MDEIREKQIELILESIQDCTSKELGYILEEIRHIKPLVGFVLGNEMAFHCVGISVIDDAVHVILDPDETF